MKILQIGTGAQAIGENSKTAVELVINSLSKELKKLGNEVDIIDIKDNSIKRSKYLDYHIIDMPIFERLFPKPGSLLHFLKKITFSLKAISFIRNLNKTEKFDIIHMHNQYPGFFLMKWLKPEMKYCKFVYTSHTPFWTLPKAEFKRYYYKTMMERKSMLMADKIIAVSNAQKEGIVEKIGISPEKIEVIYNGVDLEKFLPGKSKLSKKAKYTLISVARISQVKNQMVLVKAMPEIIKQNKNVKLVLIGQPEDKKYFKEIDAFISRNNLRGNVEIIGPVPNDLLPEYYKIADIFVSASKTEGFPLTAIEGMAAGLPLVLSDIKPHKEIKGAIIFKLNDIKDLANKINFLINSHKIKAIGKHMAANAIKCYSWKNVARKTIEAYKS